MPFTLAHPAAVLPLRRSLWFPGLVAGAMAPDVGDGAGAGVRAHEGVPGDFRQPFVRALSIVVGVLTHLLWDAFTQTGGWLVARRHGAAGLDGGPLSERA